MQQSPPPSDIVQPAEPPIPAETVRLPELGMQRLEDCALERAVKGTPTPIVSGGQLLGTWDKPDNNLLRFMLQHRRSDRYGVQRIAPGHPIYEGIRKEIVAELGKNRLREEVDTIASINAKIDSARAETRVLELHREMGEMEEALGEMALLEREVLAIPCSTLLHDDEHAPWRKWDHPSWRRRAMEMH